MTNQKHIRCSDCEYAQKDKKACTYSRKHCKTCESRDNCDVCRGCQKYDTCKARINPKVAQSCDRRLETVCSKQEVMWTAFQCTNCDSEFYRALLNVTPSGDMQKQITWNGCPEGERRCGI